MTKHVVVVASGETERRALPHLVRHLCEHGVVVDEVRIPPGNRALDVRMAESLIKATWFEKAGSTPDKFVILLDVDRGTPQGVLAPFKEHLAVRLARIDASVQIAFAQRHLEAWYFADAMNLREYLGRDLGDPDVSRPDAMQNPKLHLKHLLGQRVYTARISEDIARGLDSTTIAEKSHSFKGFLEAVMNGVPA